MNTTWKARRARGHSRRTLLKIWWGGVGPNRLHVYANYRNRRSMKYLHAVATWRRDTSTKFPTDPTIWGFVTRQRRLQ